MKRLKIPQVTLFPNKSTKPHWPTLRGVYVSIDTIPTLRRIADLIHLHSTYETNLNSFGKTRKADDPDVEELAFFAESRIVLPIGASAQTANNGLKHYPLYLLWWLGNYRGGCVYHCAWQFPHAEAFDLSDLERMAFIHFKRVCKALHKPKGSLEVPYDPDVEEFINGANQKIRSST